MQVIPIDWQTIETVFLDMDGTLLDLHFDNHFWLEHMPQRYAEKHSLTLANARKDLMRNYQSFEGSLKWYCLDHWQDVLQMDIVSLKHEVADRIAIRANVTEFLEYLRNKGKRLVLLTNAHQKTVDLKFQYVNLRPYFDRIITAHDIGLAKEEAGFWQKLEKVEVFDKTSSLFIDDNLEVLNAANQFGVEKLLAIHQPDSRQAGENADNFTTVECFTQLMKN